MHFSYFCEVSFNLELETKFFSLKNLVDEVLNLETGFRLETAATTKPFTTLQLTKQTLNGIIINDIFQPVFLPSRCN